MYSRTALTFYYIAMTLCKEQKAMVEERLEVLEHKRRTHHLRKNAEMEKINIKYDTMYEALESERALLQDILALDDNTHG